DNQDIWSLTVQPDGKVVVGGSFETFNGASRHLLTRLNADGSLDNSYNPGTNSNLNIEYGVSTLLLQPDGSLLVGGCGGTMLARLNPDGSTDPTFQAHAGPPTSSGCVYRIA